MIKASWTAPPDPPDPPRAVYELRQNAMEPSPALAGFFFVRAEYDDSLEVEVLYPA
jgi:hypothetical protein